MSSDYGTVNVDASEPVIDVQLLDVNPYSRPGTTIDEIHWDCDPLYSKSRKYGTGEQGLF